MHTFARGCGRGVVAGLLMQSPTLKAQGVRISAVRDAHHLHVSAPRPGFMRRARHDFAERKCAAARAIHRHCVITFHRSASDAGTPISGGYQQDRYHAKPGLADARNAMPLLDMRLGCRPHRIAD